MSLARADDTLDGLGFTAILRSENQLTQVLEDEVATTCPFYRPPFDRMVRQLLMENQVDSTRNLR